MAEKKFLIVVDMQRDFVDGALGTVQAQAIVAPAAARIRALRAAGYTVVATLDTHGKNYLSTSEGKKLPVVHCVRGEEGWRLFPEIEAALGDSLRVEKPTFGNLDLPLILRKDIEEGDDVTIEVIGLCTDICVISNVLILKSAFPEAKIAVNSACCAGVTPENHEAALKTMASCQVDIL